MTDELNELIARAQSVVMTPQQEQEQRVSFVYGNTKIENGRITKALVQEIDSRMVQETKVDDGR